MDASGNNQKADSNHKSSDQKTKGQTVPDTANNAKLRTKFPVVGIGASAGGLDALEKFFSAFPSDTNVGMAFVVVQHLAPDHKSMLSEIIERYTSMQVSQVKDGMAADPNHVYIIPPNRDMVITKGILHLMEPAQPRGYRSPIDIFFRSLASDQKEMAIGIVLSGTGSDGEQGVRAIKGEGGLIMVQDPETSEYTGMPMSALNTGLVDYSVEASEMPEYLKDYVENLFKKEDQPAIDEDSMEKIFDELLTQTGHDFSLYKRTTINRRIKRRMAVHQLKTLNGYANYLGQNHDEAEALFRDLLISVTNFFRNSKTFDQVQDIVIPKLFKNRSLDDTLRVWVIGCSTGEEAYSIAILLQEYMENLEQKFKVQIFATDIDKHNIEQARRGVYPASISTDITSERLKKFFTYNSENDIYRVNKDIRDTIVFSEQDVIRDPPFSKIDLLSCRNLLIYMDKEIQKHLIHLFHYSLKTGGYLLLGSSESIKEYSNLFDTIDHRTKIYKSKMVSAEYGSMIGKYLPPNVRRDIDEKPPKKAAKDSKMHMRELTERKLLQQHTPAGALVDEYGDILYLHGNVKLYLEVTSGEPGYNILQMARQGLKNPLIAALRKANIDKREITRPDVRVQSDGEFRTVDLVVSPLEESLDRKLFLVTFYLHKHVHEGEGTSPDKAQQRLSEEDKESIEVLKEELRTKEEYLEASNQELEVKNEELKSSNEEMQSINEELQSTNEELETSREELHSLNEELETVNAELQAKVSELSQANDDINNILDNTGMGIVFVDNDLRIQRFTPAATKLINLIPSDVGRPLKHTVSNFPNYQNLLKEVRNVVENEKSDDFEVRTDDDEWFMVNLRPYRTTEGDAEGAVITFTDITGLTKLRKRRTQLMERMALIMRESKDAIILQDIEGNIDYWNPMAEKMYGWSEEEALQMNIMDMIPDNSDGEFLSVLRKLSKAAVLESSKLKKLTKDGNVLEILVTATPLVNEKGKIHSVVTTEREIKDWDLRINEQD